MSRVLTSDALSDREEFVARYSDGGCTCFISPPCVFCLHPGNPLNQDDFDECWEDAPNVHYGIDGNMITAYRDDFINLQESHCGFGVTEAEALADLERQEKE